MATIGLNLVSKSPGETRIIGKHLGELAEAGDIYILTGKLGAGKTTLTQGIASGLGITDCVLSPSFVLIRELKGRLPLYHIDLYRLDKAEEISELGLDDYLYGNGVTVIEWGEKAGQIIPEDNLTVELVYVSDSERRLNFKANGERYHELIKELRKINEVSLRKREI